jgi:hypothetical protein
MEPKDKMPDGLDADIRHIADVLSKVKSPWSRYQLTMIIELCADKLETAKAVDPAKIAKTRKRPPPPRAAATSSKTKKLAAAKARASKR